MKTNTFKIFTQFLSIVILIFGVSNAQAKKRHYNSNNGPVVIDVLDDRGRALSQYSADSRAYKTQRTYLEAKKGKRYQLRIRNTTNRRVGVVLAVDGRNILTGKKSHLRNNEKMYILDPYETGRYKGWRTNKNHVNRFYFTSAGDSYSNAWGDRSAMGVIAVAVFDEKKRHYKKKHRNNLNKRSAPSRRGYLADESTGTGFGREEYSPTRRVHFKANNQPSFKHFFKYEWRNTLCKQGIVNCNYYEKHKEHNRFWPKESHRDNEYAPYPPNYYTKNTKNDWSHQFTRSWHSDFNTNW